MGLARWLILVFAIVIAALLLATGTLYFLSWHKYDQDKQRFWGEYARLVAWQLGSRTQDLQTFIQGLAEDPRVIEAALAGGRDLETEVSRLSSIVPDSLKVQILPPGLEVDQRSMSFADLDLVHHAATQSPFPSVHGFGSPQSHLAVAHAIKSSDQVIGVMLVAIDPKWLREALPVPAEGAIALLQGKLTLFYRGDPALKSLAEHGTIPVPGTGWHLRYWIPFTGLWDRLVVLVGPLLALALVVGGFILFTRWLRKALWHDASTLFTLVNDLVEGTYRGSYTLDLREFQSLVDKLTMVVNSNRERPRLVSSQHQQRKEEGAEIPNENLVSMSASREAPETPATAKVAASATTIPDTVFRLCDIRGRTDECLTPDVVRELGRVIGSEIQAQGEQTVVVGRDSRSSSDSLAQALIEGLQASGRDVIDLGTVPVPILYFANHYLTHRAGVMVTGSSCPGEYNGLKIVLEGKPYSGEALLSLRDRYKRGEISSGMGMLEHQDLLADYVGHIIDDVQIGRPIKVIVDSGAGVAGEAASALLRTLGCEVDELHSKGLLDPFELGVLHRLMTKVKEDDEAELGLAFDCDGDRVAVVDAQWRWITTDRVLMLLAADALSREPGADIVFDIECSRHLAGYIVQQGGHPVQVAPGYCNLLAKTEGDHGAILAAGFGGHFVFQERWFGTVDAIYAAARLMEILSAEPLTSDEIFAELPHSPATPLLMVPIAEEEADRIVRLLAISADKFFDDAKINTSDGIRVDFAYGWGTVRVSTSRPLLIFRFEADDQEKLQQIQERFQQWFETIELSISLPQVSPEHHG